MGAAETQGEQEVKTSRLEEGRLPQEILKDLRTLLSEAFPMAAEIKIQVSYEVLKHGVKENR